MPELIEPTQSPLRLYTIGHSNVLASAIIGLLKKYEIEVLVDVRSSPYSQYNPQFNREPFEKVLKGAGIDYLYLGDELGGRPKDPTCYKNKQVADLKADYLHLVDYPAMMQKDFFLEGVGQLMRLADLQTTAVMCSEEDPAKCHRHHLIGRYLIEQGAEVMHIRGDGNAVNGRQLSGLLEKPLGEQMGLF
jgi:uncharacterized protein (DUF488 family)